MNITHSYDGLGSEYLKARKGTPKFAEIMISNALFENDQAGRQYVIVELGIGSGQQTEFVEIELLKRDITKYKIFAYDKSSEQLSVLLGRIEKGEISDKVVPTHMDFDVQPLPIETESVDFSYMAHVYHHLSNKKQVYNELNRVTKKSGRHFLLGVVLEDLRDHPLDEFFPTKFEYEKRRYLSERQIKDLFLDSGFSYERPFRVKERIAVSMDREFLASIENTTQDSVLNIMRDEDLPAFQTGVAKVRKEVEQGEKSGTYRAYYYGGRLQVFWGRKK